MSLDEHSGLQLVALCRIFRRFFFIVKLVTIENELVQRHALQRTTSGGAKCSGLLIVSFVGLGQEATRDFTVSTRRTVSLQRLCQSV
jgi:hypothetical protein